MNYTQYTQSVHAYATTNMYTQNEMDILMATANNYLHY